VFEKVAPQVHELADHLRVDEVYIGAHGLLDLVLAGVRLKNFLYSTQGDVETSAPA
jgi:hypothetical protein